jgi:cell division protein FtsB
LGVLRFSRNGGRAGSRDNRRLDRVFSSPQAAAKRERHVSPWSYVLVSLLFSALLFGFFLVSERGFLRVRRQRQELARLQAEVSSLATSNERLEQEIASLRSDPRAVERIAREDLGFVREGEIVLQLPKGWRQRVTSAGPAPSVRRAGR